MFVEIRRDDLANGMRGPDRNSALDDDDLVGLLDLRRTSPIVRAVDITADKSAEPSGAWGVPTVMNTTSA